MCELNKAKLFVSLFLKDNIIILTRQFLAFFMYSSPDRIGVKKTQNSVGLYSVDLSMQWFYALTSNSIRMLCHLRSVRDVFKHCVTLSVN